MSLNYLDGIRAVVFDAVGTILEPDPRPADVYASIGSRHGSKLSRDVIASGFREAFDAEEQYDLLRQLATDETRERARWQAIVGAVLHDVSDVATCFQQLWEHFEDSANWKLAPGTGEVLAALRERDLKLAVASNFDSRLRSVLAGFPEARLFQDIVISSEVGWRKPAPEFFEVLCERLRCKPDELLFVGDHWENDYEGARRAGMRAVLLDPRGRYKQDECERIESHGALIERA